MKYLMPMIALLCAATISAQSLSNSNADRTINDSANPPTDISCTAEDDYYRVINGQAIDVPAPGVLANDNGADLVPRLYQPSPGDDPDYQPAGSLTLLKDGGLSYVPIPGFEGVATFTYYAIDAAGNVARARIHFYCVTYGTGTPAVRATFDEFRVFNGEVLEVADPGVLGNDFGEGLTAALLDQSAFLDDETQPHGTLTLNTDGGFCYVPAPGFEGVDSFRIVVTDASGNSVGCTVSFHCITEGGQILATDPLAVGEAAGEDSGACSAGAGAAPWMLLPMIGLALMRLRRARA